MSSAKRSVGAFIEELEHALTIGDVETTFLAATAQLGFEHAALFTCVTPPPSGGALISFARIPEAWLKHYLDQRYYEIDPVFPAVHKSVTPFNWSSPAYKQDLTKAQKKMLDESEAAGLVGGLAIPIKTPNALPACCMLTPAREGVSDEAYLIGHSLGVFAHMCAQRLTSNADPAPQPLTKRERECLLLAAMGKSDWAIGEMLGLSERTVHHAIERAKRRYGAATRVQAIVGAIAAGEFAATDALAQ